MGALLATYIEESGRNQVHRSHTHTHTQYLRLTEWNNWKFTFNQLIPQLFTCPRTASQPVYRPPAANTRKHLIEAGNSGKTNFPTSKKIIDDEEEV